jgi:hypothetical protein
VYRSESHRLERDPQAGRPRRVGQRDEARLTTREFGVFTGREQPRGTQDDARLDRTLDVGRVTVAV